MRYKFKKLTTGEKLKKLAETKDVPVTVVESGSEIILDFGEGVLTSQQEAKLKDFLEARDLSFLEKGEDLEI